MTKTTAEKVSVARKSEDLPTEWRELSLTDVYEIGSGLSKPASAFGSGFAFLAFRDVFRNYFVPENLSELVQSTEKEQLNCSIRRGDVFLTRTSETQDELGMSSVALKDYPRATFNGFSKRLRPKQAETVVPEYAAYYFRSPRFRAAVSAMSSLSTRASLNNEMISRLKISLPSLPEQAAIGGILKSLDDKIELNRKMNETLEAMARALFKSWFVDFDPVRKKQAGQPTGLPVEIDALFPGEMEDSELGEIPKGWRVEKLGDAYEINPVRTLAKNTNAPYLEMSNMPTDRAREEGFVLRPFGSGMKFINGDTLMARITPCLENGKTCFVDFLKDGEVGWGSTEYIVLRSKPPLGLSMSYFLARDQNFRAFAISNMTGTTGRQRVPAESLAGYAVTIPPAEVCHKFEEFTSNIFKKLKSADAETRELRAIRDTLLPKLISGELRVRDAERFVVS